LAKIYFEALLNKKYRLRKLLPARMYDAPARMYDAPARMYDAPARMYDAPARMYDAPARMYDAPNPNLSAIANCSKSRFLG
jgi:hypothetical protein